MSRRYELECMSVDLADAIARAKRAGMDEHFVSDLRHIASVVGYHIAESDAARAKEEAE